MIDSFGRTIDYLRISVTDRCNERCVYCMPADGVALVSHGDILSFDEIVRVVRCAASLGIRNLRLTGGEPLVRNGLAGLVRELSGISGIESVSLTTNGTLLAEAADELIAAGVRAFNISLDTTNPELYARLSRQGRLADALDGLRSVRGRPGVTVKLDTVILGIREQELTDVAEFSRKEAIHVRFIEMMPIGCGKNWFDDGILAAGLTPGGARTAEEVRALMTEHFGGPSAVEFAARSGGLPAAASAAHDVAAQVQPAIGHGPASYIRYPGMKGLTGFITALSHSFCSECNRVRLTSQGQLKTCLQYDGGADLRELLRSGAGDEAIKTAIVSAVERKPQQHRFGEKVIAAEERSAGGMADASNSGEETRGMNAIGG